MPVPRVAIVGRPNVGKSSLLNWLAKKLVSVVDPTPGVTRDRVTYLMHVDGRYFELVDTGGMGIEDADQLTDEIELQIRIGIEEAQLIVFVVDAQAGLVPLDRMVSDKLRKIDKPKLLVVNKCDSPRLEREAPEFLGLADAPLVTTSVKGNRHRDELLEALLRQLPPREEFEEAEGTALEQEPELKLAIVGRRNVGKSTFINALAQAERVIVSEVPGTTRDSIDIRFDVDGKSLVAIDTPGVRKRKSLANDVEFYGLVRAKRSIRRADVVLMFFDSQETISRVDKQLVDEISSHYKPCIFVVNKWDLALEAGMTTEKWTDYLTRSFSSMRHVPIAYITAMDRHGRFEFDPAGQGRIESGPAGRNSRKLVNLAQSIFKQARERVSTADLNKVVGAAILNNPPSYRQNRRAKVFYATQVAAEPPTIVLKCNDPKLLDETWKRYLLGVLREELPFKEVPIKLYFRKRGHDEEEEVAAHGAERGSR